jgi:hypothetical protein
MLCARRTAAQGVSLTSQHAPARPRDDPHPGRPAPARPGAAAPAQGRGGSTSRRGLSLHGPISVKYTSAPFLSRGPDRVCFVIVAEKAAGGSSTSSATWVDSQTWRPFRQRPGAQLARRAERSEPIAHDCRCAGVGLARFTLGGCLLVGARARRALSCTLSGVRPRRHPARTRIGGERNRAAMVRLRPGPASTEEEKDSR